MICDFSGIVTKGFTIPETVFSKYIFVWKTCMDERFESNCSCLIISQSELILMYELINYMTCVIGYYVDMCMFTYLHVIRLYWNWHTCIPYALEHPRTIGVSA